MAPAKNSKRPAKPSPPTGRFTIAFPDNWDSLTPEQKKAAAFDMAVEAQRQMGIAPKS